MKNKEIPDIILKKLELREIDGFFFLHTFPTVCGSYFDDFYVHGESRTSFMKRLLWLSKCAYTIRLTSDPASIIGACLVYPNKDRGNEHFFGGVLLPAYHDKGFLMEAFGQIKELAKYCYGLIDLKINEKALGGKPLFFPRG